MKYGEPKYAIGDLVFFNEEFLGNVVEGLGIIVSEPRLMLIYDWKERAGFKNNFWSYNVKIGDELFKMIPEEFLRTIDNENERDSE